MEHTEKGRTYTDIVLEVFRLSGLLISAGDELVRDIGLTSARWKVLGALSLSEEPMTVAKIASFMGQTRQGVQRLADIMVEDGLLRYEENPYHKKAKLVLLTPEGESVYANADRREIEWSNRLAEPLELADAEAALRVLKSISAGLKG